LSPTTPNLVGESVRKKGDSKRLVMPEPRYLEVIKKYLSLHPDERPLEEIRGTLSEVYFKSGDTPIKEGGYHDFGYFILRGGARSYYLKDGKEVITWFAFENDFVASLLNYKGKPGRETVEFLEDSHCVRIDLKKVASRSKTDLICSHFINAIIEEHILFLEERLRYIQYSEGLERYLYILEKEPILLRRISLTHLASYLGISRETLSRLRAKITL
jgi:CRP-like cAMP-binding protein